MSHSIWTAALTVIALFSVGVFGQESPVTSGPAEGSSLDFARLENGRPLYYVTHNVNAAITTNASAVRGNVIFGAPTGAGMTIGVWDQGVARSTHQEFGGRVIVMDGGTFFGHATHVTATIAAAGVNSQALGMAPSATVSAYDWDSDEFELPAAAMTQPFEVGKIPVANYSYGFVTGWQTGSWSGTFGKHWFGELAEREDNGFGRYSSIAETYDVIAYNAPYCLQFRSAGNDRNDTAPSTGTTFWYWNSTTSAWASKPYNSAVDPLGDGASLTAPPGFDTIAYAAIAKNVMTVGAVNDAVSGSIRAPLAGSMTVFSCWGPTDSGRIKPDIVANGVSVFSAWNGNNTDYSTETGTSMSSPNAAGTALLLQQVFSSQLPGQMMRASTLKTLILHTADDLGNAGPDYKFGFGLMNAQRAAQLIVAHAAAPGAGLITESTLDATNPTRTIWLQSTGTAPLKVTIGWTDPANAPITGLDNPAIDLVNDLDIRLVHNATGQIYFPFVLNRLNPQAPATVGDNIVDVTEQIILTSPGTLDDYTLTVSHKGSLTNGSQVFSLIVSGAVKPTGSPVAQVSPFGGACGPVTFDATLPVLGSVWTLSGGGAESLASGFVAAGVAAPASPLPFGCMFYLDPSSAFVAGPLFADNSGDWSTSFLVPFLPTIAGFPIRVQSFLTSSASPWGWTTTHAIDGIVGYQP